MARHGGSLVVLKGNRRLKAAVLLKQHLRGGVYLKAKVYDLQDCWQVPGPVLAALLRAPAGGLLDVRVT